MRIHPKPTPAASMRNAFLLAVALLGWHRQLVVDGIAKGAMGREAVGDRRNYAAVATPVASAQVANA